MRTRAWRRNLGIAVTLALLAAACGGGASGRSSPSSSTSSPTRPSTAAPSTTPVGGVRPSAPCPRDSSHALDIPYASIAGVAPALLSLDVYAPASGAPCAAAPVVMWVHGGGWRQGDKKNQITDRARLFTSAGEVLVSVNYRLSDEHAGAARVTYPAHDEDVAAAVAWVHDNIGRYGGDPQKIALLGHSAGAGIVAAVATDARYLGAHGLGLDTLKCAGPLDTEGFDVARAAAAGGNQNQLYRNAFGDNPTTWADASPINHVEAGKSIPPMLLVRRGSSDRRAGLDAFAATLRAAGITVTIVDAATLSHEQVNRQIGAAGDTVMTPAVTSFLASCFAR